MFRSRMSRHAIMAFFLSWVIVPFAMANSFTLPALPYSVDALEPAIDKETMQIHHTKHHQAYVTNLNAQVQTYPELSSLSLEKIMANMSKYNPAVRNNGGGHYNHDLFWKLMAPVGKTGAPSTSLQKAIERDFGSVE